MPGMMESLSTVNSFLRTIIAVVVLGAASAGGWYGYTTYNANEIEARKKSKELDEAKDQLQRAQSEISQQTALLAEQSEQIEQLHVDVAEKQKMIERLDTANRLLKMTHRVAELSVLDQQVDADTGKMKTTLRFVEVDHEGRPLFDPKQFELDGDRVYIDYLVVKFDDKYVEELDLDRSTSICLFQRIFGEFQEPNDGLLLETVGSQPNAYARDGKPTEFEQRIWSDFWSIANDPAKAAALGIRAAHGDAPSIKVRKGMKYRVQLRAADGLSITPDGAAPATAPAA